jgi:hypothetical protein
LKYQRKKLEPHIIDCIFLGYSDEIKGFKFTNKSTRKLIVSRNVTFIELTLT